MKINPAEPNTGIVFKRTDLKKNNYIIPGVFNVSNTSFCTTISNEFDVKVSTKMVNESFPDCGKFLSKQNRIHFVVLLLLRRND